MWDFGGSAERKARYLAAIRASHDRSCTAVHRNLSTGAVTRLKPTDGSVTVDRNASCRRMLSLTLPPDPGVWDILEAPGGEITVKSVLLYPDGTKEAVPLGVFIVDQDSVDYGPGGSIQVTAPDRWLKIQRCKLGQARRSRPKVSRFVNLMDLIEGAWPVYPATPPPRLAFPGWYAGLYVNPSPDSSIYAGYLFWADHDREAAIRDLLRASQMEAFFDTDGLAVLRWANPPVPHPVAWRVDATGVMISGARHRDRSSLHNAIVVTSAASDQVPGVNQFDPVELKKTGTDPLSTDGPLGYVPFFYQSAAVGTADEANRIAAILMRRELGIAKQLSLTTPGNAALDVEDVIKVVFPKTDPWGKPAVELHLVDQVVHPLGTGPQTILTRSTRPDVEPTV